MSTLSAISFHYLVRQRLQGFKKKKKTTEMEEHFSNYLGPISVPGENLV